MRVLVAAAHADDETLGAGGAIAKHVARGDDVRVVIAADCRSARLGPYHKPALSDEAIEAMRELLGDRDETELRFLDFGAMTLAASEQQLNAAVDNQVKEFKPDVVYTHHWCDVNTDHGAMNRAVMVAMRPAGGAQRVLCFEIPSSTEWAWGDTFRPNYFVDITGAALEKKLKVMGYYKSELRQEPHPRNIAAMRDRARYWGQVSGCLAAEPFVLAREVAK